MWLCKKEEVTPFLVETEAYEGVKRIAEKVADDVLLVSDRRPEICTKAPDQAKSIILMATLGNSQLLDLLVKKNVINVSEITGRREVFGITLLHKENEKCKWWQEIDELAQIEELLVICGSDKRGTIYGMFALSEYIGVSPLHFWGDASPKQCDEICIDDSIERISREPSVKYRGFFINDEWPCFGNWTFHHYGGFTAEMYDKVFELLLRLKGNYLWPAMWSSSFALDGPGEENAILADIYGVVIGNSHHEPCLRAGEEWDIYRGADTDYGNEWNYVTNKDGLLRFWKDGLKRSGSYESIITVGMRGERDSIMEGPQSLQENIDVLKDIITNQKELIRQHGKKDGEIQPMLLAIYKEVERYFYGADGVIGLREWDGIDDVIWMFCEDNFGHMRYLPEKEWHVHKGGYGMYYHLDYHGSPISYEWINSTPLSAIWEQMTLAYEYGIRDVWIVNVGDLKGNEYPLSYFMDLAYDFDKWGSSAVNATKTYTKQWMRKQFGAQITEAQCNRLTHLLIDGVALIGKRRPEALQSDTYHPYAEQEAHDVLQKANELLEELGALKVQLDDNCLPAFFSMIYDPLQMGLNLIRMQIYAGKNAHYASQGKKVANEYANKVDACIREDKRLVQQATERFGAKWHGMYTGAHVGFVKWNEDGCKYPLRTYVEPFEKARLKVSRADGEATLVKNYGSCDAFEIYDFMDEGVELLEIELANDGMGSLQCEILMDACEWLEWNLADSEIVSQEILQLICKRAYLPQEKTVCNIRISAGDTQVELHVHGGKCNTTDSLEGTFFPRNGIFVMSAEHYAEAEIYSSGNEPGLITLQDFGLCDSGIKCKPFDYRVDNFVYENLLKSENRDVSLPSATYRLWTDKAGCYKVEVWVAPSNPISPKRNLQFAIRANGKEWQVIDVVQQDYCAGEAACAEWSESVITQVHRVTCTLALEKGQNEIELGFLDGVLVAEKLIVIPQEKVLIQTAMGPKESWQKA